jgi:hypothetical protein
MSASIAGDDEVQPAVPADPPAGRYYDDGVIFLDQDWPGCTVSQYRITPAEQGSGGGAERWTPERHALARRGSPEGIALAVGALQGVEQ